MKKYPKAFEKWWSRADTYLGYPEIHDLHRTVKRIAFNAWKDGRSHQKTIDGISPWYAG